MRRSDTQSCSKDGSDDLGVAEALTLVGTIRFWAGRCALAEEDLERANAHARRAGSRAQEGEIARLLTLVISQGPEPVVEGLRRLEAMLEGGLADRKLEVAVASKRAELESMLGRFGPARELATHAKSLAREVGDQIALSRALSDSARVEMLAGSPAAAEEEARASYEILERMGNVGNLASTAPYLGDIVYAQGRYDEAHQLSEFTEGITIEGRCRRRGALALAACGRRSLSAVGSTRPRRSRWRPFASWLRRTTWIFTPTPSTASRKCCGWRVGVRTPPRRSQGGDRVAPSEGEPGWGLPGRVIARGARFLTAREGYL